MKKLLFVLTLALFSCEVDDFDLRKKEYEERIKREQHVYILIQDENQKRVTDTSFTISDTTHLLFRFKEPIKYIYREWREGALLEYDSEMMYPTDTIRVKLHLVSIDHFYNQ